MTEDLEAAAAQLRAAGHRVEVHASLGSTSDRARTLAGTAPPGTLIVADAQSAGRGRLGRSWWSPPGVNLYLSLLLPAPADLARAPLYTHVVVAGVHAGIARASGLDAGIKWPNDLLHGGRKLAGILLELVRPDAVIAGIGVNVDPLAQLPPELHATSLADAGAPVDRGGLLVALVEALAPAVRGLTPALVEDALAYHRAHSTVLGHPVTVEALSGVAVGLTASGALLIRGEDGREHEVSVGEVVVRS